MPLRRKRRHKEIAGGSLAPTEPASPPSGSSVADDALRLWQDSRAAHELLPPGSRRKFDVKNIVLAWRILHSSLPKVLPLCWGDGMADAITMSLLHAVRGLMPASRTFSQARILDEVRRGRELP